MTKKKKNLPSLDELMEGTEKSKKGGVVKRWLEENPEEAVLFWAAIDQADRRGISTAAVIRACKKQLGGPPGTDCTIKREINERKAKS